MTVRFIQSWNGYQPDQIVSGLSNEAALINDGIAIIDLDGGNDGEVHDAKIRVDAAGNVSLVGPNGRHMVDPFSGRKIKTVIRPYGTISGQATTGGVTQCLAVNLPCKFDAISIGYIHAGGVGAASGIVASLAASDDIGPCDYALGASDATLKKFITPKRGGTEYNTLSANGWHAVTWGGATSTGAADAGSNKQTVVWSDPIQCEAIESTSDAGWYPLLVRVYPGAGPYTTQNYSGANTGTNYNASNQAKFMQCTRTSDVATDPSLFSTSNTPALSSSGAPPIIIVAWSNNAAASVIFIGDSRFESVSETAYTTTHGFAGLPYLFQKAATAAGKKCGVIRNARSGFTTTQYRDMALSTLASSAPSVAVILGYSVNDGNATTSVLSTCKANLLRVIDQCLAQNVVPVIVPAFPDLSWNATYLANVRDFVTWCEALGYPVFNALTRYGDSGGVYLSAYNDGTLGSHMNQAGYTQMAADLADFMDVYL